MNVAHKKGLESDGNIRFVLYTVQCMVIDRNIDKYIVSSDESIRTALQKIDANKSRIIFVVSKHDHLEGILTDGDFRRMILKKHDLNLDQPVSTIANTKFDSALITADPRDIAKHFSERIQFVPLVDPENHLVAIARSGLSAVSIGSFTVTEEPSTFIIAEIGVNHNGDMALAKKMVDTAKDAGADCAKFQVRTLSALYHNKGKEDDAGEDLGSQYVLEVVNRADLKREEYLELFAYCRKKNIMPLCSAWDIESVDFLEKEADLPSYKVASADLTNHQLLARLAETKKPLLVSTGMSSEAEIKEAVALLKKLGTSYILLQCNSTYPAPFKDVNLKYLDRLKEIGECPVGYSGHERGIATAIAAVARGATVIEKHFTLDKSLPGNDHKVSLLPEEFRAMVQGIREVEESLGSAAHRVATPGELMNRATLAKSLIINQDLKMGELIEESMIETKSPGKGLQPNKKKDLVGRKAKHAFKKGDFFFESDLEAEGKKGRSYRFKRPWGLPVRYHDFQNLLTQSNPNFLEFHFSYKDLDLDIQKYIPQKLDLGLVVHSPDSFANDHLLNLAAEDESERKRSLKELQRVIDVTRSLKPLFTSKKPFIIASVGGFTKDAFVSAAKRDAWYDKIGEGLASLDSEGVEILPQTLPPFPWYFGGQLYLNLFVTPEDTAAFCKKYNHRICLDISHSKLACNHFRLSFKEFIDTVGPYIAHLHIVDAQGVDGEGVQIGEGDIDFPALAKQLNEVAPTASFIPEIWQGHKNGGEGFWIALEKLEKWF